MMVHSTSLEFQIGKTGVERELEETLRGKASLSKVEVNAFGAIGAFVNFAVAFAVSKTSSEAPKEVQDLVENIRIPSEDQSIH